MFQKYYELRPNQLNKRISEPKCDESSLYETPNQLVAPLPEKLELSSQVYSLAIDSKSNASPQ